MRFDLVKAASFPFPTQMVCFVMSVVLSRLIPPRYFANAVPASQPKETGLEQHNITHKHDINLSRNTIQYCIEM
jgi:hypothetical protein